MGFGLFGKVPQKHDFLAVNLPAAVLRPFETWLEAALQQSRRELGERWEDYYLVAPVWRFRLAPSVLGAACTGALAPSVDAGGRYFPFAIFYVAAPNASIAAPPQAGMPEWYKAVDERLLTVLREDDDAYLGGLLTGLSAPPEAAAQSFDVMAGPASSGEGKGRWFGPVPDSGIATSVALCDNTSCWWSGELGSSRFTLYLNESMPDPAIYSRMLLEG